MNRERVLKDYINQVKSNYDYVLIDCTPSLGMLTVNALTAANEVIIPVQAHFLPAKGLEQLMKTVSKVKRHINPKLKIGGILLTMLDSRTNFAKEISSLIRDTYGKNLKNGKVAEAYKNLTKEVLDSGKEQAKHRTDLIR